MAFGCFNQCFVLPIKYLFSQIFIVQFICIPAVNSPDCTVARLFFSYGQLDPFKKFNNLKMVGPLNIRIRFTRPRFFSFACFFLKESKIESFLAISLESKSKSKSHIFQNIGSCHKVTTRNTESIVNKQGLLKK